MNASRRVSMAVGGIAMVLLWGLAPGCTPSAGSYCNRTCDCAGTCTDSEHESCVTGLNDQREVAQKAGCESEFNDVLSCASGALTCNASGNATFSGCDDESASLDTCSGGKAAFGDLCQIAVTRYVAHYEECTGIAVEDPGGPSQTCSAKDGRLALCAADCFTATSCSYVNGGGTNEEANAYSNCLTACYN